MKRDQTWVFLKGSLAILLWNLSWDSLLWEWWIPLFLFTSTSNISTFLSLKTFNHTTCLLGKKQKQKNLPWACRRQEWLLSSHITALGHQHLAISQLYLCSSPQSHQHPAQQDCSFSAPQSTEKPPLFQWKFPASSTWQTLPHLSKPRSNVPSSLKPSHTSP